jgi:hypothetical protein
MIWKIRYWLCMYYIHMIWRIRCVDKDEHRLMKMNGVRRTSMDGRGWMDGQTLMDVRWNCEKHWMERNEWNCDKCRMKRNGTMTTIDGDGVVEQSASTSFTTMVCRKIFFFPFYFVFFKILFFFLFFRVATRATHYITASSKTHKSAQPRC